MFGAVGGDADLGLPYGFVQFRYPPVEPRGGALHRLDLLVALVLDVEPHRQIGGLGRQSRVVRGERDIQHMRRLDRRYGDGVLHRQQRVASRGRARRVELVRCSQSGGQPPNCIDGAGERAG